MTDQTKAARVFFPLNNTRFKYENDFGEPRFIFRQNEYVSPTKIEEFSEAVADALHDEDFDPKVDYIGLSGAMTATCVMLAVAHRLYDDLKIVCYDTVDDRYFARDLKVVA